MFEGLDILRSNLGVVYAVGWSFLIVAAVQAFKPIVKRLVKSESTSKTIVRSMPFVFGLFSGYWAGPLTVFHLFGVETTGLVGLSVGLGAGLSSQGLYSAFEEVRPIQLVKLRLYKFFGVTVKEVEESEIGDGDSFVEASYAEDDEEED